MKNRIVILGIVLFSIAITGAFSAPVNTWFEQANTFYEKEKYDSAVTYYQKIIDAGIKNSDVYYNLGNAYYRLRKLGLAILHYEKARTLAPTDREVIANLRFARLNIVDRVPEPERTFAENLLWNLHSMLPLHIQMWILFVLLLCVSIAFAIGLFASRNIRLWLIYLSSLCILISIIFSFSIGKKIYDAEKKKFAIVLEKTVDAKNQPEGSKVLFTAHEGTKFQIRKTRENWSFVSLPNGVSGWVENSSLGHI